MVADLSPPTVPIGVTGVTRNPSSSSTRSPARTRAPPAPRQAITVAAPALRSSASERVRAAPSRLAAHPAVDVRLEDTRMLRAGQATRPGRERVDKRDPGEPDVLARLKKDLGDLRHAVPAAPSQSCEALTDATTAM